MLKWPPDGLGLPKVYGQLRPWREVRGRDTGHPSFAVSARGKSRKCTSPMFSARRCSPGSARMQKKRRDERVDRFRRLRYLDEAQPAHDGAALWASQHLETLREAQPELPDELSDRQQDVVEPLLAIAEVIGGDWPQELRDALVELLRPLTALGPQTGEDGRAFTRAA